MLGVRSDNDADRPNFCGQCGWPLTDQARRLRARDLEEKFIAAVVEQVQPVMERAIHDLAADLKISPRSAKELILLWAKMQK